MRPLRPHVRAPVPSLSMARGASGARVGEVLTSDRVLNHNTAVKVMIDNTFEAVLAAAAKKWGPNGYAASIGVAGEVPIEKADLFRKERAIWGTDPFAGRGPYMTMIKEWNDFQEKNFKSPTLGFLLSDYSSLSALNDAVTQFETRNAGWDAALKARDKVEALPPTVEPKKETPKDAPPPPSEPAPKSDLPISASAATPAGIGLAPLLLAAGLGVLAFKVMK